MPIKSHLGFRLREQTRCLHDALSLLHSACFLFSCFSISCSADYIFLHFQLHLENMESVTLQFLAEHRIWLFCYCVISTSATCVMLPVPKNGAVTSSHIRTRCRSIASLIGIGHHCARWMSGRHGAMRQVCRYVWYMYHVCLYPARHKRHRGSVARHTPWLVFALHRTSASSAGASGRVGSFTDN